MQLKTFSNSSTGIYLIYTGKCKIEIRTYNFQNQAPGVNGGSLKPLIRNVSEW